MCHKNVVVSKSYMFNFSALGHGGYMISANGGSWSHNNADFNNKVKVYISNILGIQVCKGRCDYRTGELKRE